MKDVNIIFVLSLSVILFSYNPSLCQEWGEISREELNMASIPEDPQAHAVILFDIGEYSFERVDEVIFKQHKRVKVFTKKGTEVANISIPLRHREKLKSLDGCVVTKEGKKLRLDQKQVFVQKGENWNEILFALPGVEEGCVFEYRYEKRSTFTYFLSPWYFQNEEFTKLSKVTLNLLGYLVYSFTFIPSEAKTEPQRVNSNSYIWTFVNVPSLKKEPNVFNLNDHRTAIYFELVIQKPAGLKGYEAVDTWKEVGESIDDIYKKLLRKNRKVISQKSRELTNGITSDSGKAVAIYNFVRDKIAWGGERGILNIDEKFPENIFERLVGTSVEKNLLLFGLLEDAELEVFPVLISTRNYCRAMEQPGLYQFNHLIVGLEHRGRKIFIDAVKKYYSFGMLPVEDLGGYGLKLNGELSRVIEIPFRTVDNKEHYFTKVTLMEDGEIVCTTLVSYKGVSDALNRQVIAEMGVEKFVNDRVLQGQAGALLDTVMHTSLHDLVEPLEVRICFSISHWCQVTGEYLFVNPIFSTTIESNPFDSENRRFPVEFAHPLTRIEEVELSIPNGYEVRGMPESVYLNISGATFSRRFSLNGNQLKCYRAFTITKPVFQIDQYYKLRDLYQEIVKADNSTVLLSKEK